MLKTIVSVFLVLGLLSPLCLCGGVASDAHTAVTKAGASCHGAHHGEGHEHEPSHRHSDGEDSGHHHSHSELRSLAAGAVIVPPISAIEIPAWAWESLFTASVLREVGKVSEFPPDSVQPDSSARNRSSITGVFLI